MFRQRTLTVSRPVQKISSILESQIGKIPPYGKVADGHFTIYRRMPHRWRYKGMIQPRCCFRGTFSQTGAKTQIVYRAIPSIGYLLALVLFLVAFLATIPMAIQGGIHLGISVGFAIANLAIWYDGISGYKKLIREFESKLLG